MEDVLEVYERPYDEQRHDEQRPVVCLDEAAKQILAMFCVSFLPAV